MICHPKQFRFSRWAFNNQHTQLRHTFISLNSIETHLFSQQAEQFSCQVSVISVSCFFFIYFCFPSLLSELVISCNSYCNMNTEHIENMILLLLLSFFTAHMFFPISLSPSLSPSLSVSFIYQMSNDFVECIYAKDTEEYTDLSSI